MIQRRLLVMRLIVLAVILLFAGALVRLQVLEGARWRQVSERNHLRWERLAAPRGLILDRQGRTLAANRQAVTLWLVSGEVPRKGWDPLIARLRTLGALAEPAAGEAIQAARRKPGHVPIRLRSDLAIDEVSRIAEELPFLPGIYLKEEKIRQYPEGALAAHAVGYVRQISEAELLARAARGYRLGDNVGKTGIERLFEDDLRGADGHEVVEVDANGRVLRTSPTERVEPQQGKTVTLTLDIALQRAAEQALGGQPGAAIALDPATGEILALASNPGYDLNAMAGRRTPEFQQRLTALKAEQNRAVAGQYPPGSVFKIATAAAALEANSVQQGEYFYCTGVYKTIHCWKRSGHGAVSFTGAIAHSCNVAFMQMAERAGLDPLAAMGKRFGFGEKTGALGIDGESAGFLPDAAWIKRTKSPWQPGDTLQAGIGQANLLVTPLQSARAIAAIANGGQLVTLRLLKDSGGVPAAGGTPRDMRLAPEHRRRIDAGLRAVVGEGTAKQLDPTLQIAGKTGTAQNPGADHAWFVGYAPADRPRIAVAVLIEHGGHGGETAAPIAQAIIRAMLQPDGPPAA